MNTRGCALALAWIAACALFFVSPCVRADSTIPVVTVDQYGPSPKPQLDSAFFLEGNVDADVKKVAAAFVRYSYNPWDIGPGFDCTDIGRALTNPKEDVIFGGARNATVADAWSSPDAAQALQAAKPDAGAPKTAAPSAQQNLYSRLLGTWGFRPDDVYITASWGNPAAGTSASDAGAPDAGPPTFKILVPPDFFVTGARYCMFVYEQKPGAKAGAFDGIVQTLGSEIEAAASPSTCGTKDSATDCTTKIQTGVDAAVDKASAAIQPMLGATAPDLRADVTHDLSGPAADLTNRAQAVVAFAKLLGGWAAQRIALPDSAGSDLIPASAFEPKGHPGASAWKKGAPSPPELLATLIARLLVGGAFEVGAGKQDIAVTADGFVVTRLGITQDLSAVVVGGKTEHANVAVSFDSLYPFTGSKVSVLDLIKLSQRSLRTNVGASPPNYVGFDDLPGVLRNDANPSHASADLTTVFASLKEWRRLVDWSGPWDGSKSGPEPFVHGLLAPWLLNVLPPCTASLVATYAPQNAVCVGTTGADGRGFQPAGTAPDAGVTPEQLQSGSFFSLFGQSIDDWNRAQTRYADAQKTFLAKAKGKVSVVTQATSLTLEMTQKTFFTTYLTPFVGYASYLTTSKSFAEPYGGIEVYAYPNPIDEPMWTNGSSDFRRFFSVELGITTQPTGFGPGNRYAPINGGIPPFFIGLGIQPLPYVTGSLGCAFLGVRSNEVPQAATEMIEALYGGISVQGNVPDLVRSLVSSGTNTK
jgi:hypothetical protein